MQDLFVVIWQKRDELTFHTSARAYLMGALRNSLLNKSARAKLEQKWLERGEDTHLQIVDDAPIALQTMETTELKAAVNKAVDSLPPACRTIVELRFREDLSYAEIAETLGITTKTVENQLARGKQLLKARLPDAIR